MTEHLFRDTARENYFYQLGRLEVMQDLEDQRALSQEAVVRNARSQVDE